MKNTIGFIFFYQNVFLISVVFYGEQEFNSSVLNNYSLIFLPPWEIEKIEEDSIDISINKNSLGEIDPTQQKIISIIFISF